MYSICALNEFYSALSRIFLDNILMLYFRARGREKTTIRIKLESNMNHFSFKVSNKLILNTLMVLAFTLVSSSSFAQTTNTVAEMNQTEVTSTKTENVSATTTSNSMNFVLWFMGSKQDPNKTINHEGTTAKKQIITSGTAPNRLLIKAFLKKASSLESMIA